MLSHSHPENTEDSRKGGGKVELSSNVNGSDGNEGGNASTALQTPGEIKVVPTTLSDNSRSLESKVEIKDDMEDEDEMPVYENAVCKQALDVQRTFRLKHYGCFSLQMMTGVALCYLLKEKQLLEDLFRENTELFSILGIAYVVLLFVAFKLIYCRPLNVLSSLLLPVALAIIVDGHRVIYQMEIIRQLWENVALSLIALTLLSTLRIRGSDGEQKLIHDITMALYISPLPIAISMRVYREGMLHAFIVITASLLLLFWFAFDADRIRRKAPPEDLYEAVLFFYTDIFLSILLFFLSMILSLMCGGSAIMVDGGIGARSSKYAVTDTDD